MAYKLNATETNFCRDYGHSLAKAEMGLIALIADAAGISTENAAKVFGLYAKHKFIKFDRTNSRYTVKHGALLDAKTILGSLNQLLN